MAASNLRLALAFIGIALAPAALAQSAGEVERCFQNPGTCASTAPAPAPAPTPPAGGTVAARPAPDYASVLQSPDAERRRIQESLRTLDKYNGPIDGNLQSEGTVKGIGDWQRGRGATVTGKLTPEEVQVLHAEAARTPIKRIEPPAIAAVPIPPPPSNADKLKSLQAQLAERRKLAEPKANAAAAALIKDLKAYVAADGKGPVGDQFAYFATWYRDTRAAGRTVAGVAPVVEDYGDAKSGPAATVEIRFDTKQGDKTASHCMVFAWTEESAGAVRRQSKAFACDDVAGVEKWKTEQALRSAWR